MTQTVQNNNYGPGFAGLLTIVFIVLKLCGVITWSWWWVLSPIIITTAITLLIITFIIFVFLFGRK